MSSYQIDKKNTIQENNLIQDATIHNVRLDDHFTTTYNASAQDNNLSFATRGLLWYLLSLPKDWVIHRKQLYKAYQGNVRGNGKDGINKMMKELIDAGYIIYTKLRNEKGQWHHRYDVYPLPFKKFKIMFPHMVKPVTVKPATVKPALVKPPSNTKKQPTKKLPYKESKETKKQKLNFDLTCSFQMKNEKGEVVPRVHTRPDDYDSLSPDQKDVYNAFMSLIPMNPDDEPLKPYVVVNWLIKARMDVHRARELIALYLQDCKRYQNKGQIIQNMGGYITKAFQRERIGEPEHATENRKWWDNFKKQLPPEVYNEFEKGIDFPYAQKDVSFSPSSQEFRNQIKRAIELSKEEMHERNRRNYE